MSEERPGYGPEDRFDTYVWEKLYDGVRIMLGGGDRRQKLCDAYVHAISRLDRHTEGPLKARLESIIGRLSDLNHNEDFEDTALSKLEEDILSLLLDAETLMTLDKARLMMRTKGTLDGFEREHISHSDE